MHLALAALLAALASVPSPPFVMIGDAPYPPIYPVLQDLLLPTDFISAKLATADHRLGRRFARSQQFDLPTSIASVQEHAGCSTGTPGVLVYDIEHWTETPTSEQEHPGESIAAAARIVHGTHCQAYGVTPDGEFMGLGNCTIDFAKGIYRAVDWTQVDLLSIQAQQLLSDTCAAKLTVDDYAAFVGQVATYVRRKNPEIKVVTQISFRYTPTDKLIAAMRRVAPEVDGIYILYPDNSTEPCQFCSPANLEALLKARDDD
jgi:hypothetical protein